MSLRIALVVNSFPNLSETFIFNKALRLRAAGLDVTVIAHNPKNDLPLFSDRLPAAEAATFVVESPLAAGASGMMRSAAAMAAKNPSAAMQAWAKVSAVRKGRAALKSWARLLPFYASPFDIVHFEYSGLAVAYLDDLPLLRPAGLAVSCRGAAEQITPLVEPARKDLLRKLFGQIDRAHCVSNDMLRTVQQYGLDPAKAFVNYPSIDVKQFLRTAPYPVRDDGPFRIATTARLHWKKGLEYGLLSIRKLVDSGAKVQYDIIGGGTEEEPLRFAIDDLNLYDHVTLHGRKPAPFVREVLESSHAYLQPSLSEGLSNAALEAMAMEVPVVTTSAGGMAEAIVDGEHGFVTPPRDPEAMTLRLKQLADNPELCRRLGAAGRKRVEEGFTIERQTEVYLREYGAWQAERSAGQGRSA